VRLLFDTNAVVWWLADDPRLGRDARAAVADPANDVYVSAASIWEAEIKRAKRRAGFDVDLGPVLAEEHVVPLPITIAHAVRAGRLPLLHGDPFDRMLVAQAQLEGLAIVTNDRAIAGYDVLVVPA
jgi:PIN domain nuclease of toxin-antitoxin system